MLLIISLSLLLNLFTSLPLKSDEKISKSRKFYYPPVHHETFSLKPSTRRQMQDPIDFGLNYLKTLLAPSKLKITKSYKDSVGIYHIYAVEVINDIEIDNHNAALHYKNNQILSYSTSFTPTAQPQLSKRDLMTPQISLKDAISIAESEFNAKRDSHPSRQIYIETDDETLTLCHQFQLRDDDRDLWLLISVSASTGDITEIIDYYNHFNGKVIKLPHLSPLEGGFEDIHIEDLSNSSPLGWQQDLQSNYSDTRGNNCISSEYLGGEVSSDFQTPNSVINLFYITNLIHDLSYKYGFDEKSGNFQQFNFDRGGLEKDPVLVYARTGVNTATFASPPDGQKPRMRVSMFNDRDGGLDNSIIVHELMHGITNRLTGGKVGCLATEVARGMGEGWSDFLAMVVTRSDGGCDEVLMGEYVRKGGVRSRPYSCDMKVNNLTLGMVEDGGLYNQGEFWMSCLYEVYCLLVSKYGFGELDGGEGGNVKSLWIVMTGLKLQPCNPSFVQARDAILAADFAHHRNENFCLIWRGFAKRGLGVDADEEEFVDGFGIPPECTAQDTFSDSVHAGVLE